MSRRAWYRGHFQDQVRLAAEPACRPTGRFPRTRRAEVEGRQRPRRRDLQSPSGAQRLSHQRVSSAATTSTAATTPIHRPRLRARRRGRGALRQGQGRLNSMVRRDEVRPTVPRGMEQVTSRCTSPAGESPVPVSVGAPGSRPQVVGREALARAGCQEPVKRRKLHSGEQERGPQHEVKPAASTQSQRGSRAAHFTAKATATTGAPEQDVVDPSGVRGAARVHGEGRTTGGPSASQGSRQERARAEAHSVTARRPSSSRRASVACWPF